MQGLRQIVRQNQEAVRKYKDSQDPQLKQVAKQAQDSLKAIKN